MRVLLPFLSLFLFSGCGSDPTDYVKEGINLQTELVDRFCTIRDEESAERTRLFFEFTFSERNQVLSDRYNKTLMILGGSSLGSVEGTDLNREAELLNQVVSLDRVVANPDLPNPATPLITGAIGKFIAKKDLGNLVDYYPEFYKQYLANCRRVQREEPRIALLIQETNRRENRPDACPHMTEMLTAIPKRIVEDKMDFTVGPLQPGPAYLVWKSFKGR